MFHYINNTTSYILSDSEQQKLSIITVLIVYTFLQVSPRLDKYYKTSTSGIVFQTVHFIYLVYTLVCHVLPQCVWQKKKFFLNFNISKCHKLHYYDTKMRYFHVFLQSKRINNVLLIFYGKRTFTRNIINIFKFKFCIP